jgi:membrane protease YdiL (CAAX protease family)
VSLDLPAPPDLSVPKPPGDPVFLTRTRAATEVVLCSGYPTQLALLPVLAALGVQPITDGTLNPAFVFVVSAIDTVLLLGLVFLFLRQSNERPRDVFVGERAVLGEVGMGILAMPAIFALVIAVQLTIRFVVPFLHNVPVNPFESLMRSPLQMAGFLMLVVIAGGVREEIQRAFLLHRFEQRLGGGTVGLVVTSLAFGLGHTLQGWDASIVTGLLGAFWGSMYLVRRSAIANITSHACFNIVQVLAGLSSTVRT